LHVDVEIAVRATVAADVPLAGHAHARAVGQPRRDVDRQRLGAHLDLLAAAGRTHHLPQRAGAAAVRAWLREHHVAARRFHDARAVTLPALRLVDAQASGPVAHAAALLPQDRRRPLAAGDRVFELERDRLMQIDAAHRLGAAVPRAALREDFGEQIAEGRRVVALAPDADREVEALEAERRRVRLARAHAGRVVAVTPIRIAERLVGFGNLSELLLRQPIARVDVGMMLARQPLVRALDVVQRRAALEAEHYVKVHWIAHPGIGNQESRM